MKPCDVSAYVPQVWPHYQRRDRNIFFMISRRPLLELSPKEVPLYDSIDGLKTVAELEEMHPGAADRLLRWREAAVVELIPPTSSPARPHLVVIEPHMDDAALSAGGRLLHRRGRCRTTILSMVKWSNITSRLLKGNCLSVRDVTNLRQQESALAARVLGAEHRCLNWTDAPLRFWPAERWSHATVEKYIEVPQAFSIQFPNPKEVSLLAGQLMQELTTLAPDELWIPMGLGDHVDHRTTRSACLLMLAEARDRFAGVPVVMYEDLPYAYAAVGHGAQIRAALAECGTRLVRATEDITDVFEEKLRVISLYASQFKVSFLEPAIRGLAEREGGGTGKLVEAFYRLEGQACLPLESRLSWDWAGLAALQTKMRALLKDRTKCRRLTVIALPSCLFVGWKADRESLLVAFPNAELRVYASEDVMWQAEDGGKGKLTLEVVRGGWWGWLGVVWRELFRFRSPTVVLWRGAYGIEHQQKFKRFKKFIEMSVKLVNVLIKSLLPFRQVLFARALRDFCGVLNEGLGMD